MLLLLLFSQASLAQVTIVARKLPDNTPADDSIYVIGSFNNWDPQDRTYQLTKQKIGHLITLPAEVASFQFKFTRGGSWRTAEGTPSGRPVANRVFSLEKNRQADTLFTTIRGWEDQPVLSQLTFHIHKIPANTPHDASLYLAGNFNDWNPADPHYKLSLQPDSTYKLTIPIDRDTILYKLTRGNWASVECRASGRPIANHTFIKKGPEQATIQTEVAAWEDLVIGSTSFYALILIMAVVQGFILIAAVNGLQHKNKKANAILSLLIFVVSLSLVGRLASYQSLVYNAQPKLLLLSDLLYFLFGPLFYLYMQRLLTLRLKPDPKKWLHFVPALLHLFLYLPLLLQDRTTYMTHIRDGAYESLFSYVGFAALLFSAYYWLQSHKLLRKYQQEVAHTQSFEENLSYINTFLKLMAVCLCLWTFAYAIYPLSHLINTDPVLLSELSADILWVIIAVFTYFLGYYAMAQPEVFTILHQDDTPGAEPARDLHLPDENFLRMKEELAMLMERNKPYRNPKLSLQELAEMMDTNVHTISRLINEGYEKNFYDFINEYRIEDFKDLIAREQYKKQTLLALALEVGFSSKTTFYRAFKKSTGETPRKYFALAGDDQDFEEA
ncbi:MAG: helix-turn-helix domain-containing protein [Bacteroidetes bacterium]|nr:helix-turn-helix domain-containing protein [Bacteroidota bacterium]